MRIDRDKEHLSVPKAYDLSEVTKPTVLKQSLELKKKRVTREILSQNRRIAELINSTESTKELSR